MAVAVAVHEDGLISTCAAGGGNIRQYLAKELPLSRHLPAIRTQYPVLTTGHIQAFRCRRRNNSVSAGYTVARAELSFSSFSCLLFFIPFIFFILLFLSSFPRRCLRLVNLHPYLVPTVYCGTTTVCAPATQLHPVRTHVTTV
ncbi:hypothetical protein ASPSYDRAFT_780806 [Aspergillus sydowii CBS 593.65]|uniref:Uncharacterized protein n=1 Tax=Aspergillus sydowii CBS 593.65 TaxID=1036612 RepID=A0A1L9TNG9_9EURO|nr:uncharacterized protein ASPSYDRAFT_780806 [Aspergillus sydowii CBS 593.65]OJJ60958.1 hypothetical protein ASPSYDRAFT_780806 [Aspergillus sydowii CBS 593.65]